MCRMHHTYLSGSLNSTDLLCNEHDPKNNHRAHSINVVRSAVYFVELYLIIVLLVFNYIAVGIYPYYYSMCGLVPFA